MEKSRKLLLLLQRRVTCDAERVDEKSSTEEEVNGADGEVSRVDMEEKELDDAQRRDSIIHCNIVQGKYFVGFGRSDVEQANLSRIERRPYAFDPGSATIRSATSR